LAQAVLFRGELKRQVKNMVVMGDDISPIIHLRLNSDSRPIHEQNVELHKVIDEVSCGRSLGSRLGAVAL
jgi:hypothetical protein